MSIRIAEYKARQLRALEIATAQGFDVILAWSRGGSTHDHYADVFYFSGYYTHQPFVPDLAAGGADRWHWRAGGHAALIMAPGMHSALIVDVEHLQDPKPYAGERVVASDLPRVTAEQLVQAANGRQSIRVALFGGEALVSRWRDALLERVKALGVQIDLVDCSELAESLRRIKSLAEQDLLRRAGDVGSRAMSAALQNAIPGTTESDVAAVFVAETLRNGGSFYGMGLSSGPWAHTFAPSASPAGFSDRRLEEGDLLRIDAYGAVDGYLFDFARSLVVGGRPSQEQSELLVASRECVEAGITAIRPGAALNEVAHRCEQALNGSAFAKRHGRPPPTMGGFWGHGLGLSFEGPWIGQASDEVLQPGMCLAVERRLEAPGLGGSQYEENLLVTADGVELLTRTKLPVS